MRHPHHKNGFTIFFAVLVTSLTLAVGIAIYDLTVRELELASVANQSQYAINAADSGAECALYWDSKCVAPGCSVGSAFATSSVYQGATLNSGLSCNSMDITGSSGAWNVQTAIQGGITYATTTFMLYFAPQPYCAKVTVAKKTTAVTFYTTVTAHGYNTCASGAATQLERILQLSY